MNIFFISRKTLCLAFVMCFVLSFAVARQTAFDYSLVTTLQGGVRSVAYADMDKDGDLDIIAVGGWKTTHPIVKYYGEIYWYENNGSGGGWTQHYVDEFLDAISVCVADVDGDGDMDIIAASYHLNEISLWKNDGKGGGWEKTQIVADFAGACSVFPADVDGDGDIDIVAAAKDSNTVAWFVNNGTGGGWKKNIVTTSFKGAACVQAADFNNDGKIDIVGAAEIDGEIAWWRNDGGGTTWTKSFIKNLFIGAKYVHAADVDGDGFCDVVGAAADINTIGFFKNPGIDDMWTYRVVSSDVEGVSSVWVADLDGDCDGDILATGLTQRSLSWFENQDKNGTVWKRTDLSLSFSGASEVKAADFDNDGDLDIIGAASIINTISLHKNRTIHRSAIFPFMEIIDNSLPSPRALVQADINRDGYLDFIAGSNSSGEIIWYRNSADYFTSFTQHAIASDLSQISALDVGDIDNDGNLDIAAASIADKKINWYESNTGGATFNKFTAVSNLGGVSAVKLADIDGDGWQDIVAAVNENRDNIYGIVWLKNDGTPQNGGWTVSTIFESDKGPVSLAIADIDRDGRLDIVSGYDAGGSIYWHRNRSNSGAVVFDNYKIAELNNVPAIAVADINKDGWIDILAINRGTSAGIPPVSFEHILWFKNEKTLAGSWSRLMIETSASGARTLAAADLDGDGDIDIISGYRVAPVLGVHHSGLKWYENDGAKDPSFKTYTDTMFIGPSSQLINSVAVGDFNKDGRVDKICSATNNTIRWKQNRGGQFALFTDNTSTDTIKMGAVDDVFKINVIHKGRTGDLDLEPSMFHLIFKDKEGNPLTSDQATSLIAQISLYGDDGSGVFEPETDTLIAFTNSLNLEPDGSFQFVLPANDDLLKIVYGAPKTFFITVQIADRAVLANPKSFRITHATESSSAARERINDIPLTLEYAPNKTTKIITATGTIPVNIVYQEPNMTDGYDTPSWQQGLLNVNKIANVWVCPDNDPIVKIKWWGSHIGWQNTTSREVQPPSNELPDLFTIRIYNYDLQKYPQPGTLEKEFYIKSYSVKWYGAQRIWNDTKKYEHEFVYEYQLETPFPQEKDKHYMLAIQAVYGDVEPRFPWGWLNSKVIGKSLGAVSKKGMSAWVALVWPKGHPLAPETMQMAFELTPVTAVTPTPTPQPRQVIDHLLAKPGGVAVDYNSDTVVDIADVVMMILLGY
ncbi:MAG TPA: VCBS repeat-containing protein [Candidatus Sumerlaeota bacterium]|nr:MAG: FG-GAP repeat protein [candidate division BRC1 bacterium ADurb.Bin183]HOE64311.1 VCBS repeat-containing protein [Candidatus Sumerlaeota bacterium]HRR31725.1 VCBS repeat-containing protein [Candidatus Sumerlaeia bacterium]HOR65779.1 VCBS repeat-containing protein [Candidatus Sumerlaeota bacterium]HPL75577.1 VCBS repeat-containing protein [Candidatus Sumerlaeota bacterium]